MMQWLNVCSIDDLQPDSGVCALLEGEQIAIFLLDANVYAVGNYDPIGKANVLSRGLIGDLGGQPVVASPLYKQHFNLQTGICLEDQSVSIPIYAVRIDNDIVQINLSSLHGAQAL
jgi:nitrite reductase (NADH) small subunit